RDGSRSGIRGRTQEEDSDARADERRGDDQNLCGCVRLAAGGGGSGEGDPGCQMKLWSNLRRWLRGAPGPAETPQPRRPDVTPDIAQLVEGNVALARQQVAQLTGAAGAPGRPGG